MKAKLLFIHALSPLHAGTGQGVGAIDLPIAREKATGIPYVPGSSIKGVLRDACLAQGDEERCYRVFGPDTVEASAYAGSAQFTDARLVVLPVRSLAGTFAWVTSPFVLRRLQRDAAEVEGLEYPNEVPAPPEMQTCLTAEEVAIHLQVEEQPSVVLEDLRLNARVDQNVQEWAEWLGSQVFPHNEYWQQALRERLCVVHDDVLDFLLKTGTEVVARIRLDPERKTVAKGALWYEEALPAESILVGLVVAQQVQATVHEVFQVVGALTQQTLQIGGNATVGRGLCTLRLVP